jgi:Spy/CpxP family protein refolding chaperone
MKTPTLSRGLHLTLAAAALLAALFAAPRPARAAADDRPLPRHFDQLGLTDDQVQQVHAVQDKYDGEIAAKQALLQKIRGTFSTSTMIALVRVIKNLQAQRHDALLQILTDEQRQKLQELLDAGK